MAGHGVLVVRLAELTGDERQNAVSSYERLYSSIGTNDAEPLVFNAYGELHVGDCLIQLVDRKVTIFDHDARPAGCFNRLNGLLRDGVTQTLETLQRKHQR